MIEGVEWKDVCWHDRWRHQCVRCDRTCPKVLSERELDRLQSQADRFYSLDVVSADGRAA